MVQKQFEFFCHRQLQLAPMFYSTTTGGPRRPLVQRASARSSCKSGAGRALVVGDVFRRLVARALAQLFAGAFQAACLPYQFGLSTRAGTEGLYKLPHTATELDPHATVLSIDAVGAYDHVSRQAMLEGLRSARPLSHSSRSPASFTAAPALTPGSTTTAAKMMWCKAKEENRATR